MSVKNNGQVPCATAAPLAAVPAYRQRDRRSVGVPLPIADTRRAERCGGIESRPPGDAARERGCRSGDCHLLSTVPCRVHGEPVVTWTACPVHSIDTLGRLIATRCGDGTPLLRRVHRYGHWNEHEVSTQTATDPVNVVAKAATRDPVAPVEHSFGSGFVAAARRRDPRPTLRRSPEAPRERQHGRRPCLRRGRTSSTSEREAVSED